MEKTKINLKEEVGLSLPFYAKRQAGWHTTYYMIGSMSNHDDNIVITFFGDELRHISNWAFEYEAEDAANAERITKEEFESALENAYKQIRSKYGKVKF
jgi:hypothetical protein